MTALFFQEITAEEGGEVDEAALAEARGLIAAYEAKSAAPATAAVAAEGSPAPPVEPAIPQTVFAQASTVAAAAIGADSPPASAP